MSNLLIIKDCVNLNHCLKVREILDDNSLLDQQKAEFIVALCALCDQRIEK